MKTMKKGGVNSNISKKHFLYILVYGKEFYHKLLAIPPHQHSYARYQQTERLHHQITLLLFQHCCNTTLLLLTGTSQMFSCHFQNLRQQAINQSYVYCLQDSTEQINSITVFYQHTCQQGNKKGKAQLRQVSGHEILGLGETRRAALH